MDYEKAYKKALEMAEETIRYYKEHNRSNEASIEDLEQIFPELKESEDERIRKDLLAFIKAPYVYDFIVHDRVDPWIAWLEKQGEQKVSVADFKAKDWYVSKVDGKIHNIYQSVDKIEQKPISDTTYVVKAGDSLSVVNGKPFDYEHATITQKDFAPKQEWSEEDENMANDLIEGCLSSEKAYHLVHTSKEIANWLKSLKNRM